jgi:SAM-dependent methyltransferase
VEAAGWRKKLYARCYEHVMRRHEQFLSERKGRIFRDLPSTVLEVGPGAGANLRYLPPGCHWLGIEPNPYMRALLCESVQKWDLASEVCDGEAERLALHDESVEAVIATLVLCSVSDPEQALSEIHRVLRPGGRLFFAEHVGAPPGTWLRRTQWCVAPLWKWFADGCRADRDTEQLIQSAGFTICQIERFHVPARIAIPLVAPHILGIARKPK